VVGNDVDGWSVEVVELELLVDEIMDLKDGVEERMVFDRQTYGYEVSSTRGAAVARIGTAFRKSIPQSIWRPISIAFGDCLPTYIDRCCRGYIAFQVC
jgi:hypothetical protein